MSNELKTILTTIAENPQARFYVRTDVRRKWKEYDARQVLELIGSRDTKYLQCAVKKPSLVRQSPEVIPWPEKSLAINTKYYAATPELLMRAPVEAAPIIGASRATVYNWCESGGLAYSIGERNKKMIHPDEVERARKEYAGVAANILRNKV